jgi:nitrite reductase/ring-hydroxylating ferredoxin subunit
MRANGLSATLVAIMSEGFITATRTATSSSVYLNNCPHLQVPLQYHKGRDLSVNGEQIVCYAHGARFLAATGGASMGLACAKP